MAKTTPADFPTLLARSGPQFAKVRGDHQLIFAQERRFVAAILTAPNNKKLAICTPDSLQSAVMQLWGIGLSMNPALQHAYLIPRRERKKEQNEKWEDYNNNVPLLAYPHPGYRGLLYLATATGRIVWAAAEIIYSSDLFRMVGPGEKPIHEFTFPRKGEPIAVYVTVKLADGSFLTEMMDKAQVEHVRQRSEQPDSLMWKTFPEEGWKKAVIRRAFKTWPASIQSDKLINAVEMLNRNEPMNMGNVERIEETPPAFITDQQVSLLYDYCVSAGQEKTADKWLQRLAHTFNALEITELPITKFDEAKSKLLEGLPKVDGVSKNG